MLPKAYIVHRVRGRLRLRIREKRQDSDYFQSVRARLASLEGVTEVSCSDNTGSVVVVHPELSFAELRLPIQSLELFELVEGAEPQSQALSPLFEGFAWMDRSLGDASMGKFDLRSLAVIALLGLSARQIMRGNIIGPAVPMLLNALSLSQQIYKSYDNSGEA